MSQALKVQRWIDLITALLARHYGASLNELRDIVPAYSSSNLATLRRMFERDKDELRALGVPIVSLGVDGDDESRYRVATGNFYLPYLEVAGARGVSKPPRVDRFGYQALMECRLADGDMSTLADAAARVSRLGDPALTAEASYALRKLALDAPVGMLTPTPGVTVLPAGSQADPAILSQLGDALQRRKQVSFSYYGIERDETERRTVLPYGLAYTSGHWYLHGQDTARGALRRFRVSRMREVVVNRKAPGTQDFEIPASFKLADQAVPVPPWSLGNEAVAVAEVQFKVKSGRVREARAMGTTARDRPDVSRYEVRRREPFLRWLLSLSGDGVLIGPTDLVREFRGLIDRTIAAHGARQ